MLSQAFPRLFPAYKQLNQPTSHDRHWICLRDVTDAKRTDPFTPDTSVRPLMLHRCVAPQVIYRASVAAGPMAAWVQANLAYAAVLERTAPLQKALQEVMVGLSESQARLAQCEVELEQLDAQVGGTCVSACGRGGGMSAVTPGVGWFVWVTVTVA